MPFSFVEIEKRKKRTIVFLFLFIVSFYLITTFILAVIPLLFFAARPFDTLPFLFLFNYFSSVFGVAVLAAIVHWYVSVSRIRDMVIRVLKAKPPDPEDVYHQRLQNIVDEVSIATGGRKIECVVVPMLGMNAFSIDDFKDRALIGVSESLLCRLSRSQLEAVIAHEAAHIVSRDSLIRTIAVSTFNIYAALMEAFRESFIIEEVAYTNARGKHFCFPILNPVNFLRFSIPYMIARLIYGIGQLANTFLSRECEFKADAAAVKLVRDPLSLAQSLYLIGKKWRGEGVGYEYLESLFIVSPSFSKLDKQEGFLADLFSTHPPLSKRIDILLDMGHSDFATLESEAERFKVRRHKGIEVPSFGEQRWFIKKSEDWQGPFTIAELLTLGGLRGDCLVRKEGSDSIGFFANNLELNKLFKEKGGASGVGYCPSCGGYLCQVFYEGVPIDKCNVCQGVLVERGKVQRILTREERSFSDEVVREAKIIAKMHIRPGLIKKGEKMRLDYLCPRCQSEMLRTFYTLAYPIEVDKCTECDRIWFDKNELEVLQYLVEEATK